jgi:aldehyde:ferredoxin oxidoreductase
MVQATTGLKADQASLAAICAHVSDTVRRFNIQEGLTRKDDRLPPRLYKEALKTGHSIGEAELDQMLADYYCLRGWDKEGRPPSERFGDA